MGFLSGTHLMPSAKASPKVLPQAVEFGIFTPHVTTILTSCIYHCAMGSISSQSRHLWVTSGGWNALLLIATGGSGRSAQQCLLCCCWLPLLCPQSETSKKDKWQAGRVRYQCLSVGAICVYLWRSQARRSLNDKKD